MTKSKKIYPILNLAFKILIALGSILYLGYVVLYQKKEFISTNDGNPVSIDIYYLKDFLFNNFSNHPSNFYYLLAALLLTIVNWGAEVVKWKLLIGKILPVDTKIAIRSILGGVAASNITPYFIGGFFGRVAQIPFKHRLKSIAILFIGDIAAITITIFTGSAALFSLVYRSDESLQLFDHQRITMLVFLGIVFIGSILFTVIFLYLNYFTMFLGKFKLFFKVKKIWSVVGKLDHKKNVIQLLVISTIRLIAILTQYYLIFNLFGLNINLFDSFLITTSVLAIYNFIPTFNIVEFGLTRAGIYLLLLQHFISPELVTLNSTLIISCSLFLIWFINLALPSLLGSYYLLKVKLFNDK